MSEKNPNFFEKNIAPNMNKILWWFENGLSVTKIAEKLGCSSVTLYRYIKEVEELKLAFEKVKEIKTANVEVSLYKKCTGFEYPIIKNTKVKTEFYDDNGRKCVKEEMVSYQDIIYIPPDTQAIKFWLLNHASDRYRSDQPEINITNELLDKSDSILVKVKGLAEVTTKKGGDN